MYINREMEKEILDMSKLYPVITITGPRQSGKTTLVKHLFSDLPYYTLENPDTRLFAESDPRAFLSQIPKGAVIDEIQNVPKILSYLQQIVDENRDEVLFVLTGSNQFSMMNNISQSLAGRTVILKLLPFSLNEAGAHKTKSTDEILINGFYPNLFISNVKPTTFYRSYFETYIERDVKQLINIKDTTLFQKFVRLCAGRTANIFNASSIASETGVSVKTIQSWTSILEASYVIIRLQPFYENINKRLTKSTKLYFYDVGLAAYLLGIEDINQINRDPLRGALFENMIIIEKIKQRFNKGLDNNTLFYRDSHHFEVDLVQKKGYDLIPYEIKSAQTFHPDFLKGLKRFKKIFKDRVSDMYLIYDGEMEYTTENIHIKNFRNI